MEHKLKRTNKIEQKQRQTLNFKTVEFVVMVTSGEKPKDDLFWEIYNNNSGDKREGWYQCFQKSNK